MIKYKIEREITIWFKIIKKPLKQMEFFCTFSGVNHLRVISSVNSDWVNKTGT